MSAVSLKSRFWVQGYSTDHNHNFYVTVKRILHNSTVDVHIIIIQRMRAVTNIVENEKYTHTIMLSYIHTISRSFYARYLQWNQVSKVYRFFSPELCVGSTTLTVALHLAPMKPSKQKKKMYSQHWSLQSWLYIGKSFGS